MKAVLVRLASKPTLYDIILIITVIIVCILSIISLIIFNTNNAQGVKITVDGKLYSTYSFNELKNGEIIEIKTKYGYNKFIYENRSIKCIYTDCSDKLEIYAGKISKPNQILVCMPHKLTVEIIGSNNLDGISY